MQKIMGIDYGDARTGVAISDLLCTIVGSTAVVNSHNREKAIADIVKLCKGFGKGRVREHSERHIRVTFRHASDKQIISHIFAEICL